MESLNVQLENAFVSDYAILLKKMRLLRRLNRGQASLLLDFSFKNLERLKNGRGNISVERFREFQEKYGCDLAELATHKNKMFFADIFSPLTFFLRMK